MEDSIEFTDDEIRDELSKLGYYDVPDARLAEFKVDLGRLIQQERSKQNSQNTSYSSHIPTDTSVNDYRNAEPRRRVPLEESPAESFNVNNSAERRQHFQARQGKENKQIPNGEQRQEVHHIPRRPDADFSLYEETDQSQLSVRDDVSEAGSERRMVKRKVLRKEKDGTKHIDESLTESDLDSIIDINERLRELGIHDRVDFFDKKRPQSAREPPYRLSPDDPRPPSGILKKRKQFETLKTFETDLEWACREEEEIPSQSERELSPKHEQQISSEQEITVAITSADSEKGDEEASNTYNKKESSVILRKPDHPHTRNIKKNDPVSRYQQFRQSWDVQKAPGEKNHKNLRWNVREHMLTQDVIYEKKPHRVFVPNDYVVPSQKKRSNLRWQIRMDMAQGQLPHHGFYTEY